MAEPQNDIELLIARHLAGDTSSSEDQQLGAWVDSHPANRQVYEASKKAFELSASHYRSAPAPEVESINVDEEWKVFSDRINTKKVVPLVFLSNTWVRVAAVVIVALFAALYFTYDNTIVVTTTARTEVVQLPDGSKVTLNHHSTLSYKNKFGDTHREIALEGEAFFDVSSNEKLPFLISVGDVGVKVVGTSFNVQGYPEQSEVEVTVATGVVTMTAPEGALKLEAGGKGTRNKKFQSLTSTVNPDVNYSSWHTQRLVFTATPLHQVVADLNRAYHTNIALAPGLPGNCVITVIFDQQSLDAVLEVLKNTLDLTIERKGDRITITNAGC